MKTTKETIARIESYILMKCTDENLWKAYRALGFQKSKLKYAPIEWGMTTAIIDRIERIVCNYYRLSKVDFHSKSRLREIVQARQVAMYFSRICSNESLSTIGKLIGGKDHATVLHACKAINNLIETDSKIKKQIREIEILIKTLL